MGKKRKKPNTPAVREKRPGPLARFFSRAGRALDESFRPRRGLWNLLVIFGAALVLTIFAEWISRADPSVSQWTFSLVCKSFGDCVSWAVQNFVSVLSAVLTFTLAAFALYALTASAGTSVLIVSVLYNILTCVNYYKLLMRNEPLLPWDFAAAGEAAKIVSMLNIKLTPHLFIAFGATALVCAAIYLLNRAWGAEKRRAVPVLRPRWWTRLVSSAAVGLLLFGFVEGFYINSGIRTALGVSVNSWNQTRDYQTNGVLPMLLVNMRYVFAERPAGYSESAIDELRTEIEQNAREDPGTPENEKRPNIIFVMIEAYGDAEMLSNFTYSEPITPVSDWLEENAVSGYAMTSIFGGGTSITEFMALTGMSTSFLPPACTPYQQFVNRPVPAYPTFLKTLGYKTIAVHPYGSTYWNRAEAYPNLGIDVFYSLDNCFENAPRRRYCRYVTDDAVMKQVIATYEEEKAKSDDPVFIHAVTIENHQGYHAEDYTDAERVRITSSEPLTEELQTAFESYVTGLKNSDASMQILLDYFSKVDEPTILFFFGDHWGKTGSVDEAFVPAGLFDEGTLYSSHENVRRAYSVPFYIWDNYRGLKGTIDHLSVYQFVPLLTDLYGLDRPLYFEYLAEQLSVFRGHYSNTILKPDGTATGSVTKEITEAKRKMQMLQYDLICGSDYLYR